jgi:hypothetical protein
MSLKKITANIFLLFFSLCSAFAGVPNDVPDFKQKIFCGGKNFELWANSGIGLYKIHAMESNWTSDFSGEIIKGTYKKWACMNFYGMNFLLFYGVDEDFNYNLQPKRLEEWYVLKGYYIGSDKEFPSFYVISNENSRGYETLDALTDFIQLQAKKIKINKKIKHGEVSVHYLKAKFQEFNFEYNFE